MPNERELAAAAGELRYAMTKPCRNGHLGHRYTSSGQCCQCQEERYAALAAKRQEGKRLANTRLFEPARVWSGLVRPAHHPLFEQLARVCACGDAAQVEQVEAFIYMINQQVRVL